MMPRTGTPDYVASMIPIPGCWSARHARIGLTLGILFFLLAGCVPPQPLVRNGGTGPIPEDAATAQREPTFLPVGRSRFPPLALPATLSASGADPAKSPPRRWHGGNPPHRRHLAKLSSNRWPGEAPAVSGGMRISPAPRPAASPAIHTDIWARIRSGLTAPYRTHPRVVREIGWYTNHRKQLRSMLQRARPYLAYIVRQVEQRELPLDFALLPIVESGFRPLAYSPAGASGLWQFMPSTGWFYGLKQNWWYDGRRDVVASTRAALDYLTKLSRDFDGDWLLATAAYNWGEGNVRRAVARNRARGKPTDVWSLKLPGETRIHLSRLFAIAAIVADPHRYGVVLAPIPDSIPFEQVEFDSQNDLRTVANLAGITLDELYRLNPGFRRWVTDPEGPHRLLLPRHAVERFRTRFAEASAGRQPTGWARYEIVRGDTLGAIARRYRTSVAVLKKFNRLASDRILAGRHLMVPISTGTVGASRLAGTMMQTRPGRPPAQGSVKTSSVKTQRRPSVKSIHVVREGESLWRIAHRHGVGMGQLAAWNGLSPKKAVLRPGQRLAIHRGGPRLSSHPGPVAAASVPVAGDAAIAAPPGDVPSVVHVVERGDTLSEIAVRHGTTVRGLTKLNRIGADAILQLGQRLRIASDTSPETPAPGRGGHGKIRYRVNHGDTLWGISRQFGVSVADLRKWNRFPEKKPLMPGRELDVYMKRPPNT